MRPINTLYLARAFGISAVVLNHTGGFPFHGGFNLLLLLSGISFATLAFGGEQRPVSETVIGFLRPLMLGSLALCLLWSIVRQEFSPAELLMVSNWITTDRVSMFPIWYPQVLLQMMLVIGLLLSIKPIRITFVERPAVAGLSVFVLALAIAAAAKVSFDTSGLHDRLPHLHAWNFVLGWVVWAVYLAKRPTAKDRLALSLLAMGTIILMFPVLEMQSWQTRGLVFGIPLLGLIWVRQIMVPRVVAHVVLLINQATLAIFFFHFPLLWLGQEIVRSVAGWTPMWAKLAMWPFAVAGPIVIWAAYIALRLTLAAGAGIRTNYLRAGKDKRAASAV